MSSKKIIKIADNYEYYTKLLEERKSIFTEVIEINSVGNNANTLEQQEKVKHPNTAENLALIVTVKIKNYNFFQFKLRYKEFCPEPLFRFDSDGDAHRNRIDGIPLSAQVIPTPHFHKYNESGVEIAYKTDKLLDSQEAKALEDINLCVAHFLHESNIRLKKDEFPEVKVLSNSLGFSLSDLDPNANINFS